VTTNNKQLLAIFYVAVIADWLPLPPSANGRSSLYKWIKHSKVFLSISHLEFPVNTVHWLLLFVQLSHFFNLKPISTQMKPACDQLVPNSTKIGKQTVWRLRIRMQEVGCFWEHWLAVSRNLRHHWLLALDATNDKAASPEHAHLSRAQIVELNALFSFSSRFMHRPADVPLPL
jgi:hypothetical protein